MPSNPLLVILYTVGPLLRKPASPPAPPDLPGLPFKKTLRTPYFYPHFLIFQIPLSSGEGNQNLLPPPLPPFKKQEGGPNYDIIM